MNHFLFALKFRFAVPSGLSCTSSISLNVITRLPLYSFASIVCPLISFVRCKFLSIPVFSTLFSILILPFSEFLPYQCYFDSIDAVNYISYHAISYYNFPFKNEPSRYKIFKCVFPYSIESRPFI